ncbi:hypothetical protein [uncultured Clostridium sp.]|uniref:hypothetical protein n=1 Tax=uncultured Clostridium sp. TaxID=59620 RepID=UPI0025D33E85|nr:hypothetical protein [uncultured Clostridium sp.]
MIKNSEFEETTYTIGNTTTTKKVYKDGSFLYSTVETESFENNSKLIKPGFLRSSMGIEGGTISRSTYHTSVSDCTVYTNLGFAKLAFKASYTLNKGDYNDVISEAYDASTVNYSNIRTQLVRSKETSLQPARAQVTGNPVWFPGGSTTLVLNVGGNSAEVDVE